MLLSYAFGAFVLVLVLLRQTRVRPVPRMWRPRLPLFVGVIGLFEMVAYSGDHHIAGAAWLWVLATMAVGALGLGALRGLSMRVWESNGWVVRLGNATTMALWALTLLVHFLGSAFGDHLGATGLRESSFLLYLGLTLAVQGWVVHRRAAPMWDALGPDAGRPVRIDISQGPGVFFATFRGGAGGPAGWNVPAGWGEAAPGRDPTVIDADVIDVEAVDDDADHGPPELHA
jgi:hypothetical protein